ncbi:MAG: hypothetical protein NTX25_03260 [Proteobacteria bacterium]|nr:hypothetical protein [Pseudomonadota bacterium]
MSIKTLYILSLLLRAASVQAQNEADDVAGPETNEHFDITQIPKGTSITLPHPASIEVPLNLPVQVSASDKKQLLKISAIQTHGVPLPIRVAIFDKNQARVKYIKIQAPNFVVYHFKNLSTIQLVPQDSRNPGLQSTRLLLESNRPLGVSY